MYIQISQLIEGSVYVYIQISQLIKGSIYVHIQISQLMEGFISVYPDILVNGRVYLLFIQIFHLMKGPSLFLSRDNSVNGQVYLSIYVYH